MSSAGAASAFQPRSGELWCDGVAISELAARYGTPLYVYSAAAMRERVRPASTINSAGGGSLSPATAPGGGAYGGTGLASSLRPVTAVG